MGFSLALSGGGCRGAAHIGVLLALEEEGLTPDALSGASAGAIVAGLCACGYRAKELQQIAGNLSSSLIDPDLTGLLRTVFDLARGKGASLPGLLRGNRLRRWLGELTGEKPIGAVDIPLCIAAVDLSAGETVAFCDRPLKRRLSNTRCETDILLADAITASCCVPAIFAPRRIGGGLMVDGGVTDNLPVDLLLARGLPRCPVMAIDVSSQYVPPRRDNISEVVTCSFSMMSHRLADCTVRGERLLCRPKLPPEAGLFSFELIEPCIEAGYQAAKELIPLLRSVSHSG
ncbi:MAG: patatin [Oscillospiraceae bacterium]|nr:MAG: patatin [Oscillospiraceae bacterium]